MANNGFTIAIHKSLTRGILLGGVPRTLAILNGTICAAITLGLQSLYGLPVCIVIHLVAMRLAKKDPDFFKVIMRHLRKKDYYGV